MPVVKYLNSLWSIAGIPSTRSFFRGMTILQFLILILLLLDILLFYGIFLSPQGILGLHEQSRQVEELQNKISKLREDNHRLFRRIQGFKSNPQAQERLVREQLGWVRENELMIEFVEPAKNRP